MLLSLLFFVKNDISCEESLSPADQLFEKGYQLNNAAKYDEAITVFKEVLVMDPSHVRAQIYLGMSYMGKEQFEEGNLTLQKALEMDPKMPLTHYALAVCYTRKKDPNLILARQHVTLAEQFGFNVPSGFALLLQELERNAKKNENNLG